MKKFSVFTSSKIILFFLLFSSVCAGQLSNFTLTVTPTNETCTANGSLSFSTSGTTAGASMVYSIYLLPNTTTPIATLTGNTYGGLVAGNYSVVATQSVGNQSGTQQQNVSISNQITPLSYQLSSTNFPCNNNAQITVTVSSGTAALYEIISGPITKPLQTSNVFTDLTSGTYQIRVFDDCGEGVVQTYTLVTTGVNLIISNQISSPPTNCQTAVIRHNLTSSASNSIAYPLTIECTVFPPSGAPIVFNQTIPNGNQSSQLYTQIIPLFPNQNYSYNLTITDGCGNVYVRNNNTVNSNTTPTYQSSSMSCNLGQLFISVIQTATLVSAPSTYPNMLPFNYTSSIASGQLGVQNLLPGVYVFDVTDVCGNPHNIEITLNPPTVDNPVFNTRAGCDANTGSVLISSENGAMVSIEIINAPATYTASLPQNVSFNINSNAQIFTMNSLPIGSYTFRFLDVCGNQFDVAVTIPGFQVNTNTITVTENCSSFNVGIQHANNSLTSTFWLQRFDPVTSQWGNPATGQAFIPGSNLSTVNSVSLSNNSVTTNLAFTGSFRVIMGFKIYGNGMFDSNCYSVLHEFEFDGNPSIDNVYSFSCDTNTSDVVVNASGLGPLLYRIIAKNTLPFVVENGTSNVFLALEPALYTFQVEDVCGNIRNGDYDLTTPFSFQISASDFCEGQAATLSVASFPFLNYQWWEASNPSLILSTTSQLQFPVFNSATNQGTYLVSIINPQVASCINQVLTYTVNPNTNNPNAGEDGQIAYCGSPTTVDLFTILSGNFDLNGTWTELSPGVTVNGNTWNSSTALPGTYSFLYTVTGFCNAVDEATVTVVIYGVPEMAIASVNPIVCDTETLHLFATFVPNVTYQWTGPNGFTSNLQNPIIDPVSSINSGTYTLAILQNGCTSASSSVVVQVGVTPNFTMDFNCVDNAAVLSVLPIQNSFDSDEVDYLWTNTQGFSSTQNPVVITGEAAGMYTVTVTNTDGCSFTNTIAVATTLCSIPKGLSPNNDGFNDAFDLSGFSGVKKVTIFNRYGTIVFEQENYVDQWSGQDKKGNSLPSAVYYYSVHLESDETKTGWVYLNRTAD